MKTHRWIAFVLALLLAGGTTRAQEGGEPPLPLPPMPNPFGEDPVEELKQLFLEVERQLKAIDVDLADAGAGEAPLTEVADSGLDDLLRKSRERSLDAQLKIDRILEIAKEMGQSGSGSGKGKPKPGGDSPLDKPRDSGPKQRENTPDAPSEPGGEKPEGEDGEQPKDGEKPHDGEEPKDGPGQNPHDGRNTEGDPRGDQSGPQTPHGNEADEWGFLPDRFRETFRNQGRDDLPVQYRDWIDTYYRRLNRTDR